MLFTKKLNKVSKRYRKIDGKNTIEMSVKSPEHLFDGRDPAPFREKDLDEDAAKYIVTSLRELPEDQPAQLRIYIAQQRVIGESESSIMDAIRKYFEYEAEMKRAERQHFFKIAFRALFVGLLILFCFVYFQGNVKADEGNLLMTYIHEGLHLLVWVSLWQPLYYLLYEWLPIREEELLLERTADLDIQIVYRGEMVVDTSKSPAVTPLTKLVIS
jgi:hypothetical protein